MAIGVVLSRKSLTRRFGRKWFFWLGLAIGTIALSTSDGARRTVLYLLCQLSADVVTLDRTRDSGVPGRSWGVGMSISTFVP